MKKPEPDIEQAIGDIQDSHDLPTIYSHGLAALLQQRGHAVTPSEVRTILEAHGMTSVTPSPTSAQPEPSQREKTLVAATILRSQLENLATGATSRPGIADMQLALAELQHLRLLIEQLPEAESEEMQG